MSLSPTAALELLRDGLISEQQTETGRLLDLDRWWRWEQDAPLRRQGISREMQQLFDLSRTPWLKLVVTAVAQQLFVDGHYSPDRTEGPTKGWEIWQKNDLDQRQIPVHEAALAYGYSFVSVLPGVDPVTGEVSATVRGYSPREMYAVYNDPSSDEYPVYAVRTRKVRGVTTYTLFDDEFVHALRDGDDGLVHLGSAPHGVGWCPVVRFANQLDLEGRTPGEVEPYIGIVRRINKTCADRLMTQHFNSVKVRWATGLGEMDAEAQAAAEIVLTNGTLLVGPDEAKFGTLDETQLQPFITAMESDVKHLAAVSQTPTHALVGDMINLSAEALAAAEAQLQRKVDERQKSFGASWDRVLRLAAFIEGDEKAAADYKSHVTWRDTEARSLSATADALGKLVTNLGIPAQGVWSLIPGVTGTMIEEWKRLLEQQQADALLGNLSDAADRLLTADETDIGGNEIEQ